MYNLKFQFKFSFPLFTTVINPYFIVPAVITKAPTDLKLLLGTKAVFICVAESEPLHNTTWFFNGSLITNASRYSIVQSGGESVLSVDDVRLSDAGVYTCVVKNEYNVDDSAGTLEVQGNL